MKKLTKQLLIVCFVFALIVTMVPVSTTNAAVKLNKSKATIEVGKTVTLKVIGTKKKVTWTSSSNKIATVSKKGKVTAKKAGKATITAKVGNQKYTCKVTVIKKTSGKDTDKKDDNGGANGGGDSGKPVISWTGKPVSLKNIGVSIPVLDHFNSEALAGEVPEYFWNGDNDNVSEAQTMYDTLNAVRDTLIDKGVIDDHAQTFAVYNYAITFDWASASAVSNFELERVPSKNYYVLTINTPLDSYNVGPNKVAPYNRDILLAMCSIFSSKPQEVYNYIYKGLYKDASVLNMSKYKSVGDCKIKLGKESYYIDDDVHVVFYIKAK